MRCELMKQEIEEGEKVEEEPENSMRLVLN